jgi:hypothetical protein
MPLGILWRLRCYAQIAVILKASGDNCSMDAYDSEHPISMSRAGSTSCPITSFDENSGYTYGFGE